MHLLQVLIKGARPKTLIASMSPVLMGSALAYNIQPFSIFLFLATLSCALLIQILTNLANDYFDFKKGADTPMRVGPQRIMQAGLLSEATMIKTLIIISGLICITSIPLIQVGGTLIAQLLVIAILFAFLYTATPMAFAYNGFADLIVFVCFGPLAFYITQALQISSFHYPATIGIGAGSLSAALLTLNNLRDFDEDKNANKKTLVVRYGLKFGKMQILFYSLILFIPLYILYNSYSAYLLATLLLLYPTIKLIKCNTSHEFKAFFPRLILLFWGYTIVLCTCLLYI